MSSIAQTPTPPYYAVIFTSRLSENDGGYGSMADALEKLAASQSGFLGIESARSSNGLGITVSYWASEESIAIWKAMATHRVAQEKGKATWYKDFQVRVARVERDYGKHQSH